MEPLLKRLDPYDKDILIANSKFMKVAKGDFAFREGDKATHFFFINKGLIRVYKQMKPNKEVTVFFRGEQDSIGEIGIFSGATYSNSAEAVEDTSLYYISKQDMEKLISENGKLGLELTKWMAETLEASKAKLRDYLVFGSEGAVASVFIRLINMYGKETPNGIRITRPVMIQDIGKHVGISRETVSRIISKWKDQGVIDNDIKYFIVKDKQFFRKMLICDKCGVQNCVL